MLVRELLEPREELLLRDEVASFSLDRLDDDRGDLFRGGDGFEERLLEMVQTLDIAGLGLEAHRAPVALRVVRVVDLGKHGRVAFSLDRLARGQRSRSHRPPVEGAEERHDLLALGPEPRELDRGLDRLRSGVREENARRPSAAPHGSDRSESLGELRDGPRVEIGRAHVKELSRLLADRGDDTRMAVARGANGDSGGEIEESIPIRVRHHHSRRFLDDERIVLLEVLGDESLVLLDERLRLRPRKLGHDRGCGQGGHELSSEKVSSRRRAMSSSSRSSITKGGPRITVSPSTPFAMPVP